MVQCPICSRLVSESDINAHIDSGCNINTIRSTGSTSTSGSSGQSSSTSLFSTQKTVGLNTKSKAKDASLNTEPAQPIKIAPLFTSKPKPSTNQSYTHAMPPNKSSGSVPQNQDLKRTRTDDDISPVNNTNLKRNRKEELMDSMPLAARVRPTTLSEFVGQEELLGDLGILRTLMQQDQVPSMILWGPPGCGKTTVARIVSKMTKSRFIEMSATSNGTADAKKAFDDAKNYMKLMGGKTIVFVDEIHRFTKAQQDVFLPAVEQGTIRLIGATTENPSFKVNSALLSRCRVFVLKQLTEDQLLEILKRAVKSWRDKGNKENPIQISPKDRQAEEKALRTLASNSDGDARNALNTLEIALSVLPSKGSLLSSDTVKDAFQKSHLLYDRNGEEHYNIISALHKSIRGSDANAALYWLGRMLEGGEDPLYVARRLVRCASEDIGLADNTALPLAVAAYQACERIGMPECDTILAHLVTYLAETKKSVRTYKAYNKVKQTIREEPNHPVPLHIRNAPTKLMEDVGYGKGYKYNPDYEGPVDQTYLPDALIGREFLEDK
ncbi:Werner helicase interacting protein 1 [Phycomyces blakesleeanus]